nr:hypothetical protein [Chlamydiota bacterium]
VLYYGKRLLITTINDYRADLSYIFSLPSIKRSKILNPLIRENLHPKINQINFDSIGKGLCHGAVSWFNYVFLRGMESQLAQNTTSIIEYGRAVAKQFENGQPPQAALIQSLYGLQTKLLDIDEFVQDCKPENLPNGVYYLKLPDHAVSYLKFNDAQMIWDPNQGLIEIENSEQLKESIQYYLKGRKDQSIYFVFQALPIPQSTKTKFSVPYKTLLSLTLAIGAVAIAAFSQY